ncbi:hypothetical protein HPB51_016371 [Rhipicephalus microplus]|uniref:Uncharacterized protein n=1 Tax=Rhipicephalus microplus TaxID=6941 RepID=A0A9J6DIB7_RHIMP|nr:hypothetical protein HPB51_016371 [Rhipicephalus microplus]
MNEIAEICKLLKVLCLASAHEELKGSFADGSELLATALEVLKTVHLLGKSSENAFTPAQHLDDFTGVDRGTSELTDHHSFGFKRDLVQLIGNMCHHNRKHQDMRLDAQVARGRQKCGYLARQHSHAMKPANRPPFLLAQAGGRHPPHPKGFGGASGAREGVYYGPMGRPER